MEQSHSPSILAPIEQTRVFLVFCSLFPHWNPFTDKGEILPTPSFGVFLRLFILIQSKLRSGPAGTVFGGFEIEVNEAQSLAAEGR